MSDNIKYCEQCVYWSEIENDVGECRSNAPAVMEVADEDDNNEPGTVWPQTEARDWCGQGKELWFREKYIHGPLTKGK